MSIRNGLWLAAGFCLVLASRSAAQGGAEAAAQAARAADWADQQRRSGTQPSDRFRSTPRSQITQGRSAPGEDGPVRVRRKRSGAPARIGGLVYEKGTRNPVPGAIVVLASTEPQYEIETYESRTDAAGYYEFRSVEPGRWALSLSSERLPRTYATPRERRILAIGRRDSVAAPPFVLSRTACVEGHAVWSDGYVFYDAPVTVVPSDTTLFAATAMVNGVGDFEVCDAPTDSVMVWLHLRDGRRLGRSARLAPGKLAHLEFQPEPLDKMDGTLLRIHARTPAGLGVGKAQVVIVGRSFEQGNRPALVYSREAVANPEGVAEVHLPPGIYEILAMNPREGQLGRVEQYVVAHGVPVLPPLDITLRGSSSWTRQQELRADLLDRAEQFLYLWTQ